MPITDLDRTRYGLEFAIRQLQPGPLFDPKLDLMVENDPQARLPIVKKFVRELLAGKRPGFDEYVQSRIDGRIK